jgi:hypothetical protein
MVQHNDILGREIKVGDPVVYPDGTGLLVGHIDKLNPKMVRVRKTKLTTWGSPTINRYGSDVCIVDEKLVTMLLLRQ